jgi:hypothetical protein
MSTIRMPTVLAPPLAAALLLTASAAAQVARQQLSLGLTAGYTDVSTLDEPRTLQGILYGVEGMGSWSRYRVSGEYRVGRLGAGAAGGPSRQVRSLRGSLGVRVLPWIVIEGGPRMSIVQLPLDDREILRWRLGVLAEGTLVDGLATGYASASGSFAGTGISGVELPQGGGGGEVGLLLEPTSYVWARVGYRYDREYLPIGSSQTFEAAFLTVGVFMPRPEDEGDMR